MRALQLQLKRQWEVRGLVVEDRSPGEVARLRRQLRLVSRAAPQTDLKEEQQLRQLALLRARLERKGWSGAEKITPRTRWDLALHACRQRAVDVGGDDEGLPRATDGAPGVAAEGTSTQGVPMAGCEPTERVLPGIAAASSSSPGAVQASTRCKASSSSGSCYSSGASPQQRRRLPNCGSLEQKFSGSLADMSQLLGNGQELTAEESVAAAVEMSRRKRRASLTAGDDQWEDMIVKDRPRRETSRGIERDHTPLASVRGHSGCSSSRSSRERSQAERPRRERAIAAERSRRLASVAESSQRCSSEASEGVGQGGSSERDPPEASHPAPSSAASVVYQA